MFIGQIAAKNDELLGHSNIGGLVDHEIEVRAVLHAGEDLSARFIRQHLNHLPHDHLGCVVGIATLEEQDIKFCGYVIKYSLCETDNSYSIFFKENGQVDKYTVITPLKIVFQRPNNSLFLQVKQLNKKITLS